MKRKIIVNNKEFTMPKMSIDTYTEYLELAEVIDANRDIQSRTLRRWVFLSAKHTETSSPLRN